MSKFIKQLLKSISLVAVLASLLISPSVSAQNPPAGTVSLRPGQSAQFSVEYGNGGEGTNTLTNGLLYVYIGRELQLDPNSILDQFPTTGTEFRVVPSVVRTDANWSSVIVYQPRSANNPNAPSGTNVAADLNLPIGERGTLKFNATLRSDVLSRFAVGDVLVPDVINGRTEGIYSLLDHAGTGKQPGQTGVTITAPLTSSSSSSSVAPTCTRLATPGSTTGGGFNGTLPQPRYTSITFNPNPGIIGSSLTVNTNGLIDNGCNTNLEGAPCSTTLQGSGGFNATATGSVTGGVCRTVFSSSQTPRVAGVYRAVTSIQGPNGNLQTAPANIQFNVPQTATVLARTGGLEFAAIAAGLAASAGLIAYLVSRRRKLDIGK